MKHLLILLSLLILTFPLVAQETGVLYFKKVNGKFGWFESGNDKKHWKYIGEIKKGKPNGTGVLSHTFGKYSGEVNNGIVHGQGTYTYKSGRKRVGEFRKGKPWNVKSYDKNGKIETEWVKGIKLKEEGLPAVAQMAPLEIEAPTQVAMKQEEEKVPRYGLVAYNTEDEAQKIVDEMQKKFVGDTTGTWYFTIVKVGKLYQVQTQYGVNVTEEQKAFFFNILNFEYDGQMGNMKAVTKEKGFVQIFPAKPKTKRKAEMEDGHITLGVEGEVDLGVGVELDLEVDINAAQIAKDAEDALYLAHEEAEKAAKLAEEEAQRLLKEHAAEIAVAKAAAEEEERIAAETAQKLLQEAEQVKRLAAQEAQRVAEATAAARRAAEEKARQIAVGATIKAAAAKRLAAQEAQRVAEAAAAARRAAEEKARQIAAEATRKAAAAKRLAAQEAQRVAEAAAAARRAAEEKARQIAAEATRKAAAAKRAAEEAAKKKAEQTKKVAEAAKKSAAARSDPSRFKAMENIVQFETPVEIEEEKDLGLVSFVEDFTGVEKVEIPPIEEEKEVTEYKSYKMGVRVILGNTSGKASTSNSSLSLIWENYGLGFNQMSFKTTSSKNNVYEMKNSSLDLSYTIGEDWILTAGAGYVYGGNGVITSGSTAIKYETESVSGFGLFGLLGMVWEGLEGLIGVRYYSTNYTDFNSTNTSEVLSLGIPYSKSGAQLIFGLGYNF